MERVELATLQALERARQTVELLRIARENADDADAIRRNSAGGYSVGRALRALYGGESLATAAPLEYGVSMRVAERLGREPHPGCVFLPVTTRDLTAANVGAGGYLVSTTNAPGGLWVDALRAASVTLNLGVPILPAGTGPVTIPRYTGASTAYWLASEGAGPTEAQGTLGQIAATPKTVGAYSEMSRQLFLQAGPLVDAVVLRELGNTVAAGADQAILQGSGANGQPTGIINTAGVGSVSGTSLAYAGLIEFQSDTAAAVVDPTRFGYVAPVATAVTLSGRQRFTGVDSPLWQGSILSGTVAGHKAMSTGACPTATVVAGDWSQVVVLDWGGVEIGVNPFGADQSAYRAGLVGLRCFWTVDVAVLRPAAFSVATSVT